MKSENLFHLCLQEKFLALLNFADLSWNANKKVFFSEKYFQSYYSKISAEFLLIFLNAEIKNLSQKLDEKFFEIF
jgi:hypothetical protein